MNKNVVKDKVAIENLIYDIGGQQVMLDSEMSSIKYLNSIYDYIVTGYYIAMPISVLISFSDSFAKLERSNYVRKSK